jgi:hypothetical protein
VLDGVVALHIQRQGLGAEEPGNILRARGSGKGAGVLVDTVRVQVSSQGSEVEVAGLGVGARSGNVINVGENGVEETGGVAELGQFEDEGNNSNGTGYWIISISYVTETYILLDEAQVQVYHVEGVQYWPERTRVLEDKVDLHGVVLLVDAVLGRRVEVELSKLVGAAASDQGSVGQDNLKAGAQVLKLGVVSAGHIEADRVGGSVVNVLGDNVDGRLVLARGTSRVLLAKAVPGQRATSVGVVERVDVNPAIGGTGQQRGTVQA